MKALVFYILADLLMEINKVMMDFTWIHLVGVRKHFAHFRLCVHYSTLKHKNRVDACMICLYAVVDAV